MIIQYPKTFVVREECDKAAWQNGFRRQMGEIDGWTAYESTTANGRIFLASGGKAGPWHLALDHPGVIAEIGVATAARPGPGQARYVFDSLKELYAALARVYSLSLSLPDGPLQAFIAQTKYLPRTTEAERLVIQRVGQDIFRDRLMTYWGGKCPLTGITNPELLRASHIKPWAKCHDDAERLDIHNGLMLSALWDAAFDVGLVSFHNDGSPIFSPRVGNEARNQLLWKAPITLTDEHRNYLNWHRDLVFDAS